MRPALRRSTGADAVAEEVLEGMTDTATDHEDYEDEDHEDEDHEDEDGLHEIEYDEHVDVAEECRPDPAGDRQAPGAVDPEDAAVYGGQFRNPRQALAAPTGSLTSSLTAWKTRP